MTCKVSYTINNYQPVRCTIIGDDPLYYYDLDWDEFDEYEAMLYEEDLNRDYLQDLDPAA